MAKKQLKIVHKASGDVIACGPVGWGITRFEGNFYIQKKHVRTQGFETTNNHGLCVYKFVYAWLDYRSSTNQVIEKLAWKYIAPNPLLPFIWFRIALPSNHPELSYDWT